MSRIFDALQRSESERSGVDLSQAPALAAPDLLQIAEKGAAPMASGGLDDVPRLQVVLPQDSRLVCVNDSDGIAAEKFRFLGVRLRQIQQSRPLKKLLVTSTIPEEGKSTISANLSAVLARK